MSIEQTYVYKALRALDLFVSGLVFREADITISSFTGLELRKAHPSRWAIALGWFLNKIQPNHVEIAIASDLERARATITLLSAR